MTSRLFNNKGSSLVSVIAAVVIMGLTATTVVSLSSADTHATIDSLQKSQSQGLANAGIQLSVKKLSQGEDPTVKAKSFAQGIFSVTTNAVSSRVVVTAQVDNAVTTQQLNAAFAKNCVDLIVSGAFIDGEMINDIELNKSCNDIVTVDSVTISWNFGNKALGLEYDEPVTKDDDADDVVEYEDCHNDGEFVCICHVPPGNPACRHTELVGMQGWINGHSAGNNDHNMDYLGPCVVDDGFEGECEEEEMEIEELEDDDGEGSILQIDFGGAVIYQSGNIPAATSGPIESGEETRVLEASMIEDGSYYMDLSFTEEIPVGAWVFITIEFSDGSTQTALYRAGEE